MEKTTFGLKIKTYFFNFRTYKQCSVECVSQYDTCSAFEFENNTCKLGMPERLIQVRQFDVLITERIIIFVQKLLYCAKFDMLSMRPRQFYF